MRFVIPAAIALVGATIASPAPPTEEPEKPAFPYGWNFKIVDLEGPGCDDHWSLAPYRTRDDWSSTGEVNWKMWRIPKLQLKLEPGEKEASLYCLMTFRYTEEVSGKAPYTYLYNFNLHKNGSNIESRYHLDEGVKAIWKITYGVDGKEVVDRVTVKGPVDDAYQRNIYTQDHDLKQIPLQKCGEGIFSVRIDLKIIAEEKGQSGEVDSRGSPSDTAYDVGYGTKYGFSWEFERCKGT